ncbi:MAG: hypothetical protein WBQ23_12540 [Bacteroidota bacterium]
MVVFCTVALLFNIACSEDLIEVPPQQTDLDTTSHDFVWDQTIIRSDEGNRGVFHDVCYINDTCIWAVGWIVRYGQNNERELYNACRWNGKEWSLERVFNETPGFTKPDLNELMVVYGDRPDNIWFSEGAVFVHWDGNRFSTDRSISDQMKGALRECWASGPDNIWMGGRDGELAHYNGKKWKRIPNEIAPEWHISGMFGHGDTVLLAATIHYTGTTAFYIATNETVQFWRSDSLPQGVQAVWFDHLSDVWTDGAQSFQWDGYRWLNKHVPYAGYGEDISANNRNDIMICGDVGTIRHWNGKNWRSWWKWPGIESARFWGIELHENEAWVVGTLSEGGDLIIMHGKR